MSIDRVMGRVQAVEALQGQVRTFVEGWRRDAARGVYIPSREETAIVARYVTAVGWLCRDVRAVLIQQTDIMELAESRPQEELNPGKAETT